MGRLGILTIVEKIIAMKHSDLFIGQNSEKTGIYTDLATLNITYPANIGNSGKIALVGVQAPYTEYTCNGTGWVVSTRPMSSSALLRNRALRTTRSDMLAKQIINAINWKPPATLQNTGFIGANVYPAYDYAAQQQYVDVIWSARSFAPIASFGNDISMTLAPVKADGWPSGDFSILWAADVGFQTDDDGVYEGSFVGTASSLVGIDCTVSGITYDAGTNITRFQCSLSTAGANPYLTFTGISADFANLRLIRPGYAWNTTQKYTDAWMALMAPFAYLRMMDVTCTTGVHVPNYDAASQTTWASRWTPTSTPAGVIIRNRTWEEVIDIANTLNKDIWICIPHAADDSYITGLATLIRDTLRPGVKCYVEYSNEIWNTGAAYQPQYSYCQNTARAELNWYGGPYLAADITSATIASNIVTVNFARVHGCVTGDNIKAYLGASGSRVVAGTYTVTVVSPTVLTFTITGGVNGTIALSANDFIIMNTASTLAYDFTPWGVFNPYSYGYRFAWRRLAQAKDLFNSVFPAGYINTRIRFVAALQLGFEALMKPAMEYLVANHGPVANWLYAISGAPYIYPVGTETVVANAFAAMDAMQLTVKNMYPAWMGVAVSNGVKFIAYECGPDVSGMTNATVGVATNTDPAMAAQVNTMFMNAAASGMVSGGYYIVGARKASKGFNLLAKISDTVLTAPKLAGMVQALGAPTQPIMADYQAAVPNSVASNWRNTPVYWTPDNGTLWGTNSTNKIFNPPSVGSPGTLAPCIYYTFYVPADGTYTLTVRAAIGSGTYALQCFLDGSLVQTLSLPISSIFSGAAGANTPFQVNLLAGFHTLKLTGAATNLQIGFNQLTIA
jgi:hypothetical protein